MRLRCRCPRYVVRTVNDYVYEVENLRNVAAEKPSTSRFLSYHGSLLDWKQLCLMFSHPKPESKFSTS